MTEFERQIYIAKQIHTAVRLTIENAGLTESEMMEVADVYEAWEAGKEYREKKVLKYGVNADNETQLYSVVQKHVSADQWPPDIATALYKAIGIAEDGVAVWTQPYGSTDAYQKGDRVHYPTKTDPIYVSDIDNNVWAPGVHGWTMEA